MRVEAKSSFAAMRSASVTAQAVDDGGEVGVVRSHDDGDRELCRLKRVVAARGNKAAANESHRSQRIDRSQLANRIQQDDLAGTGDVRGARCAVEAS